MAERKCPGGQLAWAMPMPDGTVIRTEAASWMLPKPNPEGGLSIQLPPSFHKADIPIGTEVWSVDART